MEKQQYQKSLLVVALLDSNCNCVSIKSFFFSFFFTLPKNLAVLSTIWQRAMHLWKQGIKCNHSDSTRTEVGKKCENISDFLGHFSPQGFSCRSTKSPGGCRIISLLFRDEAGGLRRRRIRGIRLTVHLQQPCEQHSRLPFHTSTPTLGQQNKRWLTPNSTADQCGNQSGEEWKQGRGWALLGIGLWAVCEM